MSFSRDLLPASRDCYSLAHEKTQVRQTVVRPLSILHGKFLLCCIYELFKVPASKKILPFIRFAV